MFFWWFSLPLYYDYFLRLNEENVLKTLGHWFFQACSIVNSMFTTGESFCWILDLNPNQLFQVHGVWESTLPYFCTKFFLKKEKFINVVNYKWGNLIPINCFKLKLFSTWFFLILLLRLHFGMFFWLPRSVIGGLKAFERKAFKDIFGKKQWLINTYSCWHTYAQEGNRVLGVTVT